MTRKKLHPETEILQIRLAPEKKRAFEQLCLERGTTMSAVLRSFIDCELKKGRDRA